jgi:hypothetical protein
LIWLPCCGLEVLRGLMAGISELWLAFLDRTDKLASMNRKTYSYYWRFTYRSIREEWAIV